MAGLPTTVFASVAITLLAATCYAYPGPAPEPAALGGSPGGARVAGPPAAEARAAGAPQSKAEARDLQASETYGYGYYGSGYGYPLAYATYYYPRYSNYYRPYRYYSSYRNPQSYSDDWHIRYSYDSYW